MTFGFSIQLIKVIDCSKCAEYVMLFANKHTRVCFSATHSNRTLAFIHLRNRESVSTHTVTLGSQSLSINTQHALNRTCLCDVEKFGKHQLDIIHLAFRSRWFLVNDEREFGKKDLSHTQRISIRINGSSWKDDDDDDEQQTTRALCDTRTSTPKTKRESTSVVPVVSVCI